jgi:hypothetical protein
MWSSDEKIQRYRPLPYDARDGGLIEAAAPGHIAGNRRQRDTGRQFVTHLKTKSASAAEAFKRRGEGDDCRGGTTMGARGGDLTCFENNSILLFYF